MFTVFFPEEFSDRSVWWHWVGIGVPRVRVSDDQALVAITGSSNRNPDEYVCLSLNY